MKKSIFLFLAFFNIAFIVSAQTNNAILFTENGERFQVVLNGILQNTNAETNVKMTQLNSDAYKCRILFEDKKLGYVDFNLFFPSMGTEVTYNVKQNNKGQYVVRYVSDVPVAQAPPAAPTERVIVYQSVAAPVPTSTTTTTVQQTRTNTNQNSDNVNINMGVNVNGSGGSININASGLDGMDGATTTSSTTTTTHTVVTSSSSSGGSVVSAAPATVVYVNGYNGRVGCPVPMSPGDFTGMKETIQSKDFENTKLTIAKQVLQNNCLTSAQVGEVLRLFDFENTRLDYAKYAYAHTYDVGNYYKVNDAFEFESSVDELNKYISR